MPTLIFYLKKKLKITRNILFILSILFHINYLKAQEKRIKPWSFEGNYIFQLNQASFTNWAGGGQNFIGFENGIDAKANYRKNQWSFMVNYKQNYGITRVQGDTKFRKTQDILEFHTKTGWQHSNGSSSEITFFADLFTQVAPGFAFGSTERSSNFFAPAFLTEGLSYDYRAANINLCISVSALSGKQTFVLDPAIEGQTFGLNTHNGILNEMGAYLRFSLENEVLKRTFLSTNMFLFTNYLKNFGNIDIRWDTGLRVLANKWLSVNLNTNLVYNPNISLPTLRDINGDGTKEEVGSGPKVQFMQSLGIGVGLNFNSKE